MNLEKLRGNLTRAELAKMLGVNATTYHNYEIGLTEPPLSILLKLADFYNISLDSLAERQPSLSDYGFKNLSEIKQDAILKILKTPDKLVYRIDAYIDVLTNRDLPSANYLNKDDLGE